MGGAFLVELVELVLERLLVGDRVVALEGVEDDVVHVVTAEGLVTDEDVLGE
jgi:hypothetical protein